MQPEKASNKRLIALASGAVPDTKPPETISVAHKAGFNSAGLWIEPENWSDQTTQEVKSRINDTGIKIIDVEVVMISPGPTNEDHFKTIDIGAEVGAKNVLIVSMDPDRLNTIKQFELLCEHAGKSGLRAVLEFMMFMQIRTIEDALDVVKTVSHPAGGILVDSLHLERSGGRPDSIKAQDPSLFPYIQICDAPLKSPGDRPEQLLAEALDSRLSPGEGGLPVSRLLKVLPENIPLSLEVRSKAYRDNFPDPVKRAKNIYEHTRYFLDKGLENDQES